MPESPTYFRDHSRHWSDLKYIYPVISRRSGGLSIGINLNLDGVCNFDCVYCQVLDRKGRPPQPIIVSELIAELRIMLDAVSSGVIWEEKRLHNVPPEQRILRDLAFSGDGEPTACRSFAEAASAVATLKNELDLDPTRLVVLSNCTLLDRPAVRTGLAALAASGGLIWAKLDAGTQSYYEKIDRSPVPLDRVVSNIASVALPVVIQTMLCRIDGAAMSDNEFAAYMDRVKTIVTTQNQVEAIHLYTTARDTMESNITPLTTDELNTRADRLRDHLDDAIPVLTFS